MQNIWRNFTGLQMQDWNIFFTPAGIRLVSKYTEEQFLLKHIKNNAASLLQYFKHRSYYHLPGTPKTILPDFQINKTYVEVLVQNQPIHIKKHIVSLRNDTQVSVAFENALHCIESLVLKYGPFRLTPDMLKVTRKNILVIWIHENQQSNVRQYPISDQHVSQQILTMILDLINIFSDYRSSQFLQLFKTKIQQQRNICFKKCFKIFNDIKDLLSESIDKQSQESKILNKNSTMPSFLRVMSKSKYKKVQYKPVKDQAPMSPTSPISGKFNTRTPTSKNSKSSRFNSMCFSEFQNIKGKSEIDKQNKHSVMHPVYPDQKNKQKNQQINSKNILLQKNLKNTQLIGNHTQTAHNIQRKISNYDTINSHNSLLIKNSGAMTSTQHLKDYQTSKNLNTVSSINQISDLKINKKEKDPQYKSISELIKERKDFMEKQRINSEGSKVQKIQNIYSSNQSNKKEPQNKNIVSVELNGSRNASKNFVFVQKSHEKLAQDEQVNEIQKGELNKKFRDSSNSLATTNFHRSVTSSGRTRTVDEQFVNHLQQKPNLVSSSLGGSKNAPKCQNRFQVKASKIIQQNNYEDGNINTPDSEQESYKQKFREILNLSANEQNSRVMHESEIERDINGILFSDTGSLPRKSVDDFNGFKDLERQFKNILY